MMTPQTVERITQDYYSRFCGIRLSEERQGTFFTCSPARAEKLKGLGCKYAIYILVTGNLCAASYSPEHKAFMEGLRACGRDDMIAAAGQRFQLKRKKLMIFEREAIRQYGGARILSAADYPRYESFFRRAYPDSDPDGWLHEYFAEKTAKEYFTGYFINGQLVSVCDAPDMPYMEDKIQHTGICTLKEERRKGYAACTAALAAHHLMEMGICPQWECGAENIASIALAKSIGYREYGEAYILEEWD